MIEMKGTKAEFKRLENAINTLHDYLKKEQESQKDLVKQEDIDDSRFIQKVIKRQIESIENRIALMSKPL